MAMQGITTPLISWGLWLKRNVRTFQWGERLVVSLFHKIREDARTWGFAGAKYLAALVDEV